MNTNGPSYAVNPGTGPGTRGIADAGAVEERARYYAGLTALFRFDEAGGVVRNNPAQEWRTAFRDEAAVVRVGYRLLSATDDASAIREAWPTKSALVPAPATAIDADPAQAWAEANVTRKLISEPTWLHVEAGFASLYLITPAREYGYDNIDDLRRLVAAIFRAGVAHERARAEGLCDRYGSDDNYCMTDLIADIRSGRDLRTEAK